VPRSGKAEAERGHPSKESCGFFLSVVVLGHFSFECRDQGGNLPVCADFAEAIGCENQAAGKPTISLFGFLSPSADPPDMAAQVLEEVLDAVGR